MATKKYTAEEARERKNARQREYAKKTHYRATTKSEKENTRRYVVKAAYSTDADIIEWLESIDNKMGYIKQLIRDDIQRNSQQ
ncbi:MAG: hypothetical protein UIH27_00840 [Ruminococcus sp.]|nr:hypothetical protein [Ruminococcus sp.]